MSTLERLAKEVEERLAALRRQRYSVPKEQRVSELAKDVYESDPLPADFVPSHEAYKRVNRNIARGGAVTI